MFIIYLAVSPSGKVYVGQTKKTLAARVSGHVRQAFSVTAKKYPFQHALVKYGPASFVWDTIAALQNKRDADAFEQRLIAELQSQNPIFGYNLASGGEGHGGIPSWNKGQVTPPDVRKKQSDAKRGRPSPKRGLKGKPHSAATRAKMKASQRSAERVTTPVRDQHGTTYPSIAEAARQTGFSSRAIIMQLAGKTTPRRFKNRPQFHFQAA